MTRDVRPIVAGGSVVAKTVFLSQVPLARLLLPSQPLKAMRVGEYTARILVDGKELEEYEVTVDASETQATCWVASEVGKVYAPLFSTDAFEVLISFKKFTVQWKCHFPTRLLESSGYVTLDGTECGGKYMRCGLLGKNDTANISSISCGTMERDFIFSSLQLSGTPASFP